MRPTMAEEVEDKTVQKMDKDFFKRTDAFIKVANELATEQDIGKVSASMLYAAARFNAFIVASSAANKEEAEGNKLEAINYFTEQYRSMLTANMDDYIEKYDDYLK
jgi:heme-binding NEAT domain protein